MKLKELYGTLLTEQSIPVAGQYYCNLNTTQGHACTEIIDATDPIYNDPNHPPYPSISQTWTPGVPTKISLVAIMPFASSVPAFYNDQQSCESVCGNHYFQNCSSSPFIPQSFYHLTTSQKNGYCERCRYNRNNSTIKSHPYCWCLDNGGGGGPIPPLGTSIPLYTCPQPVEDTWDCVKQALDPIEPGQPSPSGWKYGCVSTVDGSGQYTNLQDCEDNCDTTGPVGPIKDDPISVAKKKPVDDDSIDQKLKEEVKRIKELL